MWTFRHAGDGRSTQPSTPPSRRRVLTAIGGAAWCGTPTGSGKSIEMLLYAAKIMRSEAMGNPRIVMLTDRNDLDDQLTWPSCWRSRTSSAQARRFSELLDEAINRYTNRALSTAEIIAALVELAKAMRTAGVRAVELGLAEDEVAFYDAVCQNDAAVLELGDDTLKAIARSLVTAVRQSATIDWNLEESVQAELRAEVRRLLTRYDYPPDKEGRAIELVLEQAQLVADAKAA